MLEYHRRSWTGGIDPPGKGSTLAFSRARRFDMMDAPEQRLEIDVAAQRRSGLNLLRVFSSGHEIVVDDAESLTVMLPRNGRVDVRHERDEVAAFGGGAIAFAPSLRRTRVDAPAEGPFEACLLKLPVLHPLLRAGGRAGAAAAGRGDPHLPVRADAAAAFADLIRYILADLASPAPVLSAGRPAELADVLVEEHVRKLFEPAGWLPPAGEDPSARVIRRANDVMRTRFADPLSVGDIAEAVGVGTRRLQSVFKTETGLTPWEHLTAIRLENVRLLLLSARRGATVSMIALDCGFTHLGRFAQRYREVYAEAPSDTLRRSPAPDAAEPRPGRNLDGFPRDPARGRRGTA